ncbi:MAG: hypothetical protein WD875_07905, partial [Pirellulales bacterium]
MAVEGSIASGLISTVCRFASTSRDCKDVRAPLPTANACFSSDISCDDLAQLPQQFVKIGRAAIFA